MHLREGTPEVAQVFKALGNEGRLTVLCALLDEPHTVKQIVECTGISQPMVSQHLRLLRECHLVTGERNGQEVVYTLADHHVIHVITDTYTHVVEGGHDHV